MIKITQDKFEGAINSVYSKVKLKGFQSAAKLADFMYVMGFPNCIILKEHLGYNGKCYVIIVASGDRVYKINTDSNTLYNIKPATIRDNIIENGLWESPEQQQPETEEDLADL